jgi:hypothetical protein
MFYRLIKSVLLGLVWGGVSIFSIFGCGFSGESEGLARTLLCNSPLSYLLGLPYTLCFLILRFNMGVYTLIIPVTVVVATVIVFGLLTLHDQWQGKRQQKEGKPTSRD